MSRQWEWEDPETFFAWLAGLWFLLGFIGMWVTMGTRGCTPVDGGTSLGCGVGNPHMTLPLLLDLSFWFGPYAVALLLLAGLWVWNTRPRRVHKPIRTDLRSQSR